MYLNNVKLAVHRIYSFRRYNSKNTIEKTKIEAGSRNPAEIMDRLANRYAGKGTMNTNDGLRIDFGDSWVHLRSSNTEPIIRIITEAPEAARAKELANSVMRDALE